MSLFQHSPAGLRLPKNFQRIAVRVRPEAIADGARFMDIWSTGDSKQRLIIYAELPRRIKCSKITGGASTGVIIESRI
jgi:hypothetical protein